MTIKTNLRNLLVRALAESMGIKMMVEIVREFIDGYDLHQRLNLRDSISIPQVNAAKQIVEDLCQHELFSCFVQFLIEMQTKGFKGRKYKIAYLPALIKGLEAHGYIFDYENNMFIEDSQRSQSINWGVLREGLDYELTFLRFDIAGNSQIVRANSTSKVQKAYQDFFNLVHKAVKRRNGRVWQLEGDGGLLAFAFKNKDTNAALSAVEILHELLIYNCTFCPLKSPLKIRIAIHAGRHLFSKDLESLNKSEPVKEVKDIEISYTKPNSCTISHKSLISVDKRLADLFTPIKERNPFGLSIYTLELK